MSVTATAGSVAGAAAGCLGALKGLGFDFFCGVADSTLAGLIEELERDPAGYLPATREDLAVGMAAGAFLAGRWPAVLMQNSGLGYCLNALTSLNLIYRIPVLLIVGYRGFQGNPFDPAQDRDAPEHEVMGAHCEALLRQVGIPVFAPEASGLGPALEEANRAMRQQKIPVALFIRRGVL